MSKKTKGILGMNARNLLYTRPYNSKKAIRLANDKLKSKEVLFGAGVPVPKLFGVIRDRKELEVFKWGDLPKSFVLKPNKGGGGEGIKIIYGQRKDQSWISTEGKSITIKDLQEHIMNIFDGVFSLSGIPDIAFFEERVQLSKIFKPYAYRGIPDVRVIIFNKIPVMAMLRLPTKESGGKANLHLGGIGLGVDIATGVTTHAIMHDQHIEKTPDTKLALSGIKIPHWREILEIAIKCQITTQLGYAGIDIAIDKERGPVVLEVNARPGLSIQNANLAPLKYRLKKVKGLKVKNEIHGIRIAQDLFGGEVEQEIREISGKQIIGIIETVKVKYFNQEKETEKKIGFKAKIDTGADSSSMDKNLAKKLGYEKIIDEFDKVVETLDINKNSKKELLDKKVKSNIKEWGDNLSTVIIKSSHGISYRLVIRMKIIVSKTEILSRMSITDRSNLKFPVIIGRKDLGKFLVDPSKSQSHLIHKDDFLINARKEKSVEDIMSEIIAAEKEFSEENVEDKEKITSYSQEIEKTAGKFNDIYSFINISGNEGRNYALEISDFLKKIKDKEHNPIFGYPTLNNFKIEQFESALDNLENISRTVDEEENDLLKQIIREAIFLSKNKISFLMAVKQKEELRSFEYAKRIYGDISDNLVRDARNIYDKLLKNETKDSSADIISLKNKIFNSKQIAKKFREAMDVMGFQQWDIALDKESSQIDVKFRSVKYSEPTIAIPHKKRLNGINLAKKIIHEVIHIKTNSSNEELGFAGVIFGRDYELYQEGIARIIENDFVNEIFGVDKELPNPYYILSMEKVKEGYNYRKTFDYISELKLEECKARNIDQLSAEKISKKEALFVCRRIFRGFRESLSKGGAYFPKDKIYLEGEILARKMYNNNLGDYLIAAKIDPYLLPLFIKLGILNRDKLKYNIDSDLEIYKKLFLE